MILSLFLVMGLSTLIVYQFSLEAQLNQIRERLKVIAQTATLMIDTEQLLKVPLSRSGIYTAPYKAVAEKLNKIKNITPSIKYIYTLTRTNRPGIYQFIVDPNPILILRGKKRSPTAYPGDLYDARRFPQMLSAFKGATADTKIMRDEWGTTLSGYAPLYDKNGKAVAILGVDMSAEDVHKAQQEIDWRITVVLVIGIFFSLGLGLLISHHLTGRIDKLVEATRHIAEDELEYKVEVKGNDEITELAGSFNKMAVSLSDSKKKLQDYFYRAVQALVRILEAKDPYTCGHSERVAEYAGKIGLAMGFSQAKVALLQKAAELHDIGKLVIHENILNKKEPLTPDEWKIIREHPIMGEEVLRPILIDEELLWMIRSHHERYDGQGYPDKLRGDNISIFAQIVSVADAYDAMVSKRAYREALSKDTAIVELKIHSGTQFNTQVVNAFLKVLESEKK